MTIEKEIEMKTISEERSKFPEAEVGHQTVIRRIEESIQDHRVEIVNILLIATTKNNKVRINF
jgi:hypothetical protein